MDQEDDNVINLNAKREQKRRKSQSEKEQEQEDLLAAASDWHQEKQLREVLSKGCYFVKRQDGKWLGVKRAHFANHYPEWTTKFAQAVTSIMEMRGHTYLDVTYTYKTCHADVLNLLDRSGWLELDIGDYHWLFDVLIQSLGGNKPPNIEHIEEVLVYKYQNPASYTLPCLVIHGEGGVGKNVLVDTVLYLLFGRQTYSGVADDIIGDFNALVKGMAVVMIDEAEADAISETKLKHMLNRARLTINDKGIPQYEIDNTPLYLIGSNKSEGGVWLDRSQADRRYSVLHVKKGQSLAYWVALHMGLIPADQKYISEDEPAYQQATRWLKSEGSKILSDPTQIACWMGSLFLKHGDKPEPLPLHGDDFKRLMDIQKPMDERVFEAVFNDPDFDHIERRVLHKGYVALCDEDGQKRHLKEMKFYEKLRDWVERNKPHLIETQITVAETALGLTKESRPRVWIARDRVQVGGQVAGKDNRHRGTRHKYIADGGQFGRPKWVGPEV